jgi:hypothetical protein
MSALLHEKTCPHYSADRAAVCQSLAGSVKIALFSGD